MSEFLKIILVDDEPKNVRVMQELLSNYCDDIEIIGTANSVQQAQVVIQSENPDLVFLDIEMPFGNAFNLLEKYKSRKFEVVFITAFDEYALKAFKFEAVDYLLKPVSIIELRQTLEKVRKRIHLKQLDQASVDSELKGKSQQEIISISNSKGGIDIIPLSSISKIEASGGYSVIYTTDSKKHLSNKSIKEFEDSLDNELFFRIHHSYIINRAWIKKYINGRGGFVECVDGTQLEVAARRKKDFLTWLSPI